MYCDIIQRIRDFHILSERSERFAKAEEGLTADLMRLDDFFSLVGNEKEEDVAGQLAQFQEKAMLLPQKEAEMNRRQQQLDEFLETVDIESLEKIDCPQGDESELTEKIRIYEDQIEDLRNNAKFVRISSATVRENHPHDISITKEAPNYSTGFQS